jgi:hypothetical protein
VSDDKPVGSYDEDGKARLDYGPEPGFPKVLIGAWVFFAIWAAIYIISNVLPAYREWATGTGR